MSTLRIADGIVVDMSRVGLVGLECLPLIVHRENQFMQMWMVIQLARLLLTQACCVLWCLVRVLAVDKTRRLHGIHRRCLADMAH
jgi:hypothetical protein